MKQFKKLTFYEVNPRYFKDYSGNGVGDLKGLSNNFEYFEHLGVDAIILKDVLSSDGNNDFNSFTNVDPTIGEINDIVKIVSLAKKAGIKILIDLNIGTIKESHDWFSSAVELDNENFTGVVDFKSKEANEDLNYKYSKENNKYYISDEKTQEIPLNWKSSKVMDNFMKVVRFWNDLDIDGFVIKKFEYIYDETKTHLMSEDTLKELRKFYRLTKEIKDSLLIVGRTFELPVNTLDEYTTGPTKVLDYVLTEKPSFVGISSRHGNDILGYFSPKILAGEIKKISKSNTNILTFGSDLTARALSKWMNDGQYIKESAKALGMLNILTKSSSSIYYGEEIGTPNIGLTHLDDFQTPDLKERKNEMLKVKYSESKFMDAQVLQNPINSRSLMAWNSDKNGGFSSNEKTITPVSTSFKEINVKNQFQDESSVLNFYKELIRIATKSSYSKVMQNGTHKISSLVPGVIKYKFVLDKKEIIVYVNLTGSVKLIKRPSEGKIVLSTYHGKSYDELPKKLEAYEGIMVSKLTDEHIKTTQQIKISELKAKDHAEKVRIREEEKQAKFEEQELIRKAKAKEQAKIDRKKAKDAALKQKIQEEQAAEKERILAEQKVEKEKEAKRIKAANKRAETKMIKLKEKEKAEKEEAKTQAIELKAKEKLEEQKQKDAMREAKDKERQIKIDEKAKEQELRNQEKTRMIELKEKEREEKRALKDKERQEKIAAKELERELKEGSETFEKQNMNNEMFEVEKEQASEEVINKSQNEPQRDYTSSSPETPTETSQPDYSQLDSELEELKKETSIEREEDKSHLDDATNLKEEELAKTTLIDDTIDLDELFEEEENK